VTRSTSSRKEESATTASTPGILAVGVPRGDVTGSPWLTAHVSRQAAIDVLWTTRGLWIAGPANRGLNVRYDYRRAVALRNDPAKGTTPARGGGGEGRRVSAPGGRADTPSAQGRVLLTIHTTALVSASVCRQRNAEQRSNSRSANASRWLRPHGIRRRHPMLNS
jgi:hypothetical protein